MSTGYYINRNYWINDKTTIKCKIPPPRHAIKMTDSLFHPEVLMGRVMNTFIFAPSILSQEIQKHPHMGEQHFCSRQTQPLLGSALESWETHWSKTQKTESSLQLPFGLHKWQQIFFVGGFYLSLFSFQERKESSCSEVKQGMCWSHLGSVKKSRVLWSWQHFTLEPP